MLFRLALLEGGAEERLSAGFGCRQPAAASLSAAGPVPESGASSQKWQAAGRQNAAFGQILGAGAFEAAGKPCPTGCGTALPSGQPERATPRDSRKGAQIGQKLLPGQELPISIHAPREGSDLWAWQASSATSYFYPRSPQGERQYREGKPPPIQTISIHAPREGSDLEQRFHAAGQLLISIHAPREGSDDKIQQTSKMDFA